jgi:hypothetical protein
MDASKLSQVRSTLLKAINLKKTVFGYITRHNYKEKVEHFGIRPSYDPEGVMMVSANCKQTSNDASFAQEIMVFLLAG